MTGMFAGLPWIGLALAAIAGEAFVTARTIQVYEARESEDNFGLAFGFFIAAQLTTLLTLAAITFAYAHRAANLGRLAGGTILLFLVADFLYYLWHRANHRWRWLWATHVVHHSARRMNFLMSFRQGWTDAISGTWLFWMPLGFLGFPPIQCGAYFGVLVVWQFWVHNEWMPRLGPIEWVMVTASHHRVHHSLRPEHIDRNFGGVFIIWDRLLGTFAPEGARLTAFGIAGHSETGPLRIAFGEWRAMFGELSNRIRQA